MLSLVDVISEFKKQRSTAFIVHESGVELLFYFFSVNVGNWVYSESKFFNMIGSHMICIDKKCLTMNPK